MPNPTQDSKIMFENYAPCVYFNFSAKELSLIPEQFNCICVFDYRDISAKYGNFSIGDIVYCHGKFYAPSRYRQIMGIWQSVDRVELSIDHSSTIHKQGYGLKNFCDNHIIIVPRNEVISFFDQYLPKPATINDAK